MTAHTGFMRQGLQKEGGGELRGGGSVWVSQAALMGEKRQTEKI